MKISSIYIDRLAKSLAAQGITLKRTQLLELAAAAFGFHNQNEFTGAAKRGDMTPPAVQPIGTVALPDGQRVILVNDATANTAYGIDEAFVERVVAGERAEKIGVTPYGHLAWLDGLADQVIPELSLHAADVARGQTIQVYTAMINHKHGTNAYSASSEERLYKELADYCAEYWPAIAGRQGAPEFTTGMSDREIVSTYFEVHNGDHLDLGEADLVLPPELLASLTAATPSPAAAPMQSLLPGAVVPELPSAEWLRDVASVLSNGQTADIWFHAHDFDTEADRQAEATISETQSAMSEAARILIAIADGQIIPSPALVQCCGSVADERAECVDPIVFLTDHNGDALASRANCQHLTDDELAVVRDRQRFVSAYEGGATLAIGYAVLLRGQKFHAPTIEFGWGDTGFKSRSNATAALEEQRAELAPAIKALGGHIQVELDVTASSHELRILLPFFLAAEAGSLDDYFRALDYLINGGNLAPLQVRAQFIPQAWQNDYAVSVDPEGDTDFDVTFEMLLLGADKAGHLTSRDYDSDELRYAARAPEWIRDWSGPFGIDVDPFEIDQLFNIVR